MLLGDFFFSFKNVHISFYEKKKIIKLLKVGAVFLYKFIILDQIFHNFFYKKDLDRILLEKKELQNKDLLYLFKYFNSLKQEHNYEEFFHENFKEFKKKDINILEIGAAKGDGIASFYFYFPNSNLISVDNNPFRIRYKSKRIRNIYADISSKTVLRNLTNHLNQKFDIILEDCSHKLIDQIICFIENFKNLKNGGIYVVEDLNFPEIHEIYNPTKEAVNLKLILQNIISGEKIISQFMDQKEIDYIKNNIEDIKIFKCKNKKNYLIEGLTDYSEIAFIKKK
tara:strand:- start:41 stop:886 length:846 start_codon:yes stop_codon:yes gene_type:complete